MIFIIIHHIIYQVVTPNFDNRMYACVDVFLHTAVIIFVLITGYFGLRFSWHKAMLLLFQVLFYSEVLLIFILELVLRSISLSVFSLSVVMPIGLLRFIFNCSFSVLILQNCSIN